MSKVSPATLRKKASALLVLVFVGATASNATPKHSPAKPAPPPTKIIAHLVLSGGPASQMFLREQNGNEYLLIRQTSETGVTVIDVTKPSHPSIVKRTTWPNDTSIGNLEIVGDGLAFEETPESAGRTLTSSNSKETVQVVDLSDPANPRAILSFSGVTSVLDDEARKLVYITNDGGLWILRNNQALAAAAKHACNSDDAYNETASCQ